jgi:para-aminobenzoate synthetase
LAVAIRTLVTYVGDGAETTYGTAGDGVSAGGTEEAASAELTLGVGGAITADSVPDEEYDEIRVKAHGVLSALGAEFPVG